jgi:hypothetical protein
MHKYKNLENIILIEFDFKRTGKNTNSSRCIFQATIFDLYEWPQNVIICRLFLYRNKKLLEEPAFPSNATVCVLGPARRR